MKKVIPAILLLFFFVQVLVSQTTNGRIQIVKDPSGSYICNIQANVDNDTLLLVKFHKVVYETLYNLVVLN